VKEAGAHVLRGGVWKPRTNPYAFQGDDKSLDILMEASRRAGLPVDTEVMDEDQLKLALAAGVPMLQVGARNASLFAAPPDRAAVAGRKTIVLLKRSLHMGTLHEFISAAEYIANFGNPNVILCPRGTAPALDGYRNFPDESIVPLLKERTWAPVVVDPSHSVGKASYVPACSLAALAYGATAFASRRMCSPAKALATIPNRPSRLRCWPRSFAWDGRYGRCVIRPATERSRRRRWQTSGLSVFGWGIGILPMSGGLSQPRARRPCQCVQLRISLTTKPDPCDMPRPHWQERCGPVIV